MVPTITMSTYQSPPPTAARSKTVLQATSQHPIMEEVGLATNMHPPNPKEALPPLATMSLTMAKETQYMATQWNNSGSHGRS